MAKTTRTKSAATGVPVPQSRDEAAAHLRLIGEQTRAILRLEAQMNDRLGVIKAEYEAKAAPLRDRVSSLQVGLQIWCEAHRDAITGGDKKSADLGTGVVKWRLRPPSVRITGVEQVIERLKQSGLGRYLREKIEVSKEAILAEPDEVRGIAGISIGSAGEEFIVEPFETQLSGEA